MGAVRRTCERDYPLARPPGEVPAHASAFPDRATGAHRADVPLRYPDGSLQLCLFFGESFVDQTLGGVAGGA